MANVNFEDIKKANETIVTTDIKGKDYAEVNQRIKAFRMVYPDGSIRKIDEKNENGICEITIGVYEYYIEKSKDDIDAKLLATGTAYEKEGSTFINKTSYIENCETSAVGRALGMAGFGIDTSVASAEEVLNAMKQQDEEKQKQQEELEKEQGKPITKKLEDALLLSIKNNNMTDEQLEKILKKYNYGSTKEIKMKDYMNIVNDFKNEIK